jgi:hypothetical protein
VQLALKQPMVIPDLESAANTLAPPRQGKLQTVRKKINKLIFYKFYI